MVWKLKLPTCKCPHPSLQSKDPLRGFLFTSSCFFFFFLQFLHCSLCLVSNLLPLPRSDHTWQWNSLSLIAWNDYELWKKVNWHLSWCIYCVFRLLYIHTKRWQKKPPPSVFLHSWVYLKQKRDTVLLTHIKNRKYITYSGQWHWNEFTSGWVVGHPAEWHSH